MSPKGPGSVQIQCPPKAQEASRSCPPKAQEASRSKAIMAPPSVADRANLDLPLEQEDKPAGEVLGRVATTTRSPRARAPADEHCCSRA